MTPAAHHLLRALYLHAMAPSTANQDAVRAAGAALDAAYHVAAHETPDGMARLFPSREAACVWLAAMGKVPV